MLLPTYEKSFTQLKFFGREEYIDIFNTKLDNVNNNNIDLLMFYGIGGIGKSALLNNLYTNYSNNNYKIKINLEESNTIEKFYANLLKELDKQNIRCFNLKIAYSIYWKKLNPNNSLKDNILFNSPQWDGVISIIDNFSFGFGTIFKAFSNSTEMIKSHINKHKEELLELESLSISEIEILLPKFFNYDLTIKLMDKQESLIFYIDTYEYLYENNKKEFNKLNCDKFIRDLILSTYYFKALFVLVGREKLVWAKENIEWNEYIDLYNLDSFSFQDSIRFLKINDIREDIAIHIAKYTEGVPFYLNLEINTYRKLRNPTINDFSSLNTKTDIFNRFLQYTSETEVQLLKTLSLANYFDMGLFENIIKEFNIPVSVLTFTDFIENSFIKEDNGKYYIHNLMKSSIITKLNNELKNKILNYLFKYYTEDINIQIDYAINIFNEDEFKEYVTSIFYLNLDEYNNLNKFMNKAINFDDQLSVEVDNYFEILSALLQIRFDNNLLLHKKINSFTNINNNIKNLLKFYNLPEGNKNLIWTLKLDEFKKMDLNLYILILLKYLNIFRKIKKYKRVEKIISEINDIISNNKIKSYTLFEFYTKLSIYYKDIKKFDDAINTLEKATKFVEFKVEEALLYRNYALIFNYTGTNNMDKFIININKSIEIFDSVYKEFNDESNKCFNIVINNNTTIDNINFEIYSNLRNKNINIEDYVIHFLNNTNNLKSVKNFINLLFKNLANQKREIKLENIIPLINDKFENNTEFNFKYYNYYLDKDIKKALYYIEEAYRESKNFNEFIKIAAIYYNNKMDGFEITFAKDIEEFPYPHKLEIFKLTHDLNKLFELLEKENHLSTLLNHLPNNVTLEFLLDKEEYLKPFLQEKMDIYFSYIIEKDRIYNNAELTEVYLLKQLNIRKEFKLNNYYKGLFFLGKEYFYTQRFEEAKKYLILTREYLIENNIEDVKLVNKINKFLNIIDKNLLENNTENEI